MITATPSSTFNIQVESQGLLGTPYNPELQSFDRRVTTRLIFTIILTMRHGKALLRYFGTNHVSSMGSFQNLT